MRTGFLVLLLAFAGVLLPARADVIFSGIVSTYYQGNLTCSGGGAGAPLNLDCEGPPSLEYARVSGSGDPFSGSMSLHDEGGPEFGSMGLAKATIGLSLNENYVLRGGTGSTTLDFAVDPAESIGGFIPSVYCSFTFDGMAQSCGPIGTLPGLFPTIISETVEYGVPFSIGLDVVLSGMSPSEPGDAYFSYDFTQPGLVLTPEPSSILLLMPGLAGVVIAARSRKGNRLTQD